MRKHVRTFALTAALAMAAALGTAVPAEAASPLQLRRIQYDSPGTDTRSNTSLNKEYVTVKNISKSTVNLKNHVLHDRASSKGKKWTYAYTFGSISLKAGASVKVRTGKGRNTSATRYWQRGSYVWNNTGDTATLRNSRGTKLDSCTWKKKSPGYVNC
ncbi:lamin tail-like protein [Murinocardiopsis flavida]|uniref:Lamin tail-like protein n=1 Tax=Murinocardiopsis flavida TaxID=645275 RepID=A0A2P8DR55_9ACTN|nr:lamin tail domain-containing protein [Murinocardiopsis flavida]PSK99696.1 lamin tail-like protein [Murinocardiopsis flavida]